MAQKVQTLYVDDLDGSEVDGTIRFGLDGAEYEIDLNAKHAQEAESTSSRAMWPLAGASAPAPASHPAADVKRSRTL